MMAGMKEWSVVTDLWVSAPFAHTVGRSQLEDPRDSYQTICRKKENKEDHRMLGIGRNLCGSSSPTLLPKQGYLQ